MKKHIITTLLLSTVLLTACSKKHEYMPEEHYSYGTSCTPDYSPSQKNTVRNLVVGTRVFDVYVKEEYVLNDNTSTTTTSFIENVDIELYAENGGEELYMSSNNADVRLVSSSLDPYMAFEDDVAAVGGYEYSGVYNAGDFQKTDMRLFYNLKTGDIDLFEINYMEKNVDNRRMITYTYVQQ